MIRGVKYRAEMNAIPMFYRWSKASNGTEALICSLHVLGIGWKDTCNGLVKDGENHEFLLRRHHQPGNRSEGSGN
jgi:hypothetical protein